MKGFTLLESLIAVLLLSLGMLGAWAVLLASLQSHRSALYEAWATNLVRDMADRIRANAGAGALYDSRLNMAQVTTCDAATPCDLAQRAAADLAAFTSAAQTQFPGADTQARVEFEPAAGLVAADRYVISLRWRGVRDDHSVTLQLLTSPAAG
jgi:type IV pilus modification protein PilV